VTPTRDFHPLAAVFPALEWPSARQVLAWIDDRRLPVRDQALQRDGRIQRHVDRPTAASLAVSRPAVAPGAHPAVRLTERALEDFVAAWYDKRLIRPLQLASWDTQDGPRRLSPATIYTYGRMLGLPTLESLQGLPHRGSRSSPIAERLTPQEWHARLSSPTGRALVERHARELRISTADALADLHAPPEIIEKVGRFGLS